ncbi:hypothetical protein [Paenibacillus taichungensis]|nr:hypothetical protein [Paenibacillus taichungensis]
MNAAREKMKFNGKPVPGLPFRLILQLVFIAPSCLLPRPSGEI